MEHDTMNAGDVPISVRMLRYRVKLALLTIVTFSGIFNVSMCLMLSHETLSLRGRIGVFAIGVENVLVFGIFFLIETYLAMMVRTATKVPQSVPAPPFPTSYTSEHFLQQKDPDHTA